jgi:hypothetical protein
MLFMSPPKTRNSCDHPYLSVMVTGTCIAGELSTITYKLCCQYGRLRGVFARESIQFEEYMTPEIVQIDTMKPKFDAKILSVEEASAKHNILGEKSYCQCRKDCALVPKCSCIALGKLCREKCHGGSKNMNKVKCSNCIPGSTVT